MENNHQHTEQLIKYLANELNAEEKVVVESWVNASGENQRYFEHLKNAWQLASVKGTLDYVLDEMNVEEKWNRFKQMVTAKEGKVVSITPEEQFGGEYLEEEKPVRKPLVYRLLVSSAIAASVLLVIGLGWKLFVPNKKETPVALDKEKKVDSVTFVVHHEVNTTGKEKTVSLADGSLIVLADNSEITYRLPFTGRRDILLSGKAFFKVAKDKTKPFTVTSGAIATTALGTEFTVTAFEKSNKVIVRLYEGKVVIKPLEKGSHRMKRDVYLFPGQEFIYGNPTMVRRFNVNSKATEEMLDNDLNRDNPLLPQNATGSWHMFNNQPLGQVFDQLADMYNVKIVYDKQDVAHKYFVGRFNKSDSLDIILKYITIANQLTITKKENTYIIGK